MKTTVSKDSSVYYQGSYWNDFPLVLEYMCENFTGNKNKWWMTDFQERFCSESFEQGLFINCGNGWVERTFVDLKIVNRATAFDYSIDLIHEAQQEKGDRAIDYFQADVNRLDFDNDQFDLIVNVAALHHVQYINRLCVILCRAIKKNGIFVNFDYIGPHRNQYLNRHWGYIRDINQSLPEQIRKEPFVKPHLPTMLHADPTEAIHSELILETINRYFDIFERHDTGGGIAYEILTHNPKLHKIPPEEIDPFVDWLLRMDKKFTEENKVPPLFSYFIARPKKEVLENNELLEKYQAIEELRERKAYARRGTYSNRDYLKVLINSMVWVTRSTIKRIIND
jgi:SAM-dependent methyltransferase